MPPTLTIPSPGSSALAARNELVDGLRRSGLLAAAAAAAAAPGPGEGAPDDRRDCSVLRWAASGAMALTGAEYGPPRWPTGDIIGRLEGIADLLRLLSRQTAADLTVDVPDLLTQRATARGSRRRGAVSVGGASRLLRTLDSWVALSLARPSDEELLPALTGGAVPPAVRTARPADTAGGGYSCAPWVWAELERYARGHLGAELTEAAQRLGLPAGLLGHGEPGGLPWSIGRIGESVSLRDHRLVVVDFSAMWAGPLCAHLLGRCGAEVIKVEDVGRPDAARHGDTWLFEELHRGHRHQTLDFQSPSGRERLGALVDRADVVIEASRPRALAALGFDPDEFLTARPGRTWVSVTGYGRRGPRENWVAFGDDAAVAGGLVARHPDGTPVFCADAIADPVSGLCAATGAMASIVEGGGHLVDCSMQAAAAFAATGGGCDGDHRVDGGGDDWTAFHGGRWCRIEPPRPLVGLPAGRAGRARAGRSSGTGAPVSDLVRGGWTSPSSI